jgi:hypothetical protein
MSLASSQVQPETAESQRLVDRETPVNGARAAEPLSQGEILIRCPRTGAPVTTGLRIDWVVFSSLPPVAVPLRCPACGRIHKWKPQEAWINSKHPLRVISS